MSVYTFSVSYPVGEPVKVSILAADLVKAVRILRNGFTFIQPVKYSLVAKVAA